MQSMLPEYLSDLSFTLNGNVLQFYAMEKKPDWFHLALTTEKYPSAGLFVCFKKRSAEVKDQYSIKRYCDGASALFTGWDEATPAFEEAPPFEEWIRTETLKRIDRILSWHIEGIYSQYPIDENMEIYLTDTFLHICVLKFKINLGYYPI